MATVRGQSALDGCDPNANGMIRVVVTQPDGKILIGGDFTSLSPNGGAAVTRNRIARLNPDGTLDSAFNPNANGTVNAIAVQADGKVLVGGSFNGANSIGGQTRNRIARLDAATGLADSFDPNSDNAVFSLAVQAGGKILAGGFFTNIGGQPRNRIARLDAISGLADSFDPNANGPEIFAIVVQTDAKILVGGFFTSIGGQPRNNIARLDPRTGLADSFNPNASDEVRCLAVQADGRVLAGGFFTLIGGQTRNSMARLDSISGVADSFNPNPNGGVFAIAVQADGRILAGGEFFSIGGQSRHVIARLDATTGLADSFDPSANGNVNSIAVQADGKIMVGGGFSTFAPNGGATVTRNRIARLETDGRLDRTLNLSTAGNVVVATALQPDGKILIGGTFTNVLGVARNNIARLNTDGTLDTAFNPNSSGGVISIAVQADGKVLVGGFYGSIGGQVRNNIARLDAATGLADSFNPNANERVVSIAVQRGGKILAAGSFTSIGGQTRNRIARLDATTGLADSFNPNADNPVFSITVQADDKILAGGAFTSIGGLTRNRIARLDATTGLADSFNPNADGEIEIVAVQAGFKILAGGDFTSIGGQARNRIARLDAITGLADSFDPNASDRVYGIAAQSDGRIVVSGNFSGANSIGGQTRNHIARLDAMTGLADSFNPNANGSVNTIALQVDGKVLAGGQFSNIGGQARSLFARLTNDIAALQNLALAETDIIWSRGGSSPQFTRVTFESSTDNMTYSLLGNGLAAGSNWTLPGLNLPTGQNIYIRAHGYRRSGGYNGSESLTESLRNVFIVGAPPTPTPSPTASPPPSPTATPSCPPILTQSSSQTITTGNSISCNNGTGHTDNSYWRAFDLAAATGGASGCIFAVSFGVESVNQTQPVTVRLYMTSNFPTGFPASLTQIGAATLSVSNAQNGTVVTTPLMANIPAGTSQLVMELFTPDGQTAGNLFFVGSNADPELGPSYLTAAACGVTTPTTTTDLGFPNMHVVFNVSGNFCESCQPTASPTATATATAPTSTPTPTPFFVRVFWEGFDAVRAPALPASWVTSFTPGPANCTLTGTCALGTNWTTSSATSQTAPNAAFHDAPSCVTDSSLDTPSIFIPVSAFPSDIYFWHNYDLEGGHDGGVLEVSIDGGPFIDIVTAGGSFVGGAYNGTISTAFLSPIAGRQAWTGNSGGYINSYASLPAGAMGHNVVLRFRLATDCGLGGPGWYVDSIQIAYYVSDATPPPPTPTATATASLSPTPTATASGTPAAQAVNLSTRMRVGSGVGYSESVGIGGFIIAGPIAGTAAPKHVLLRAIGPSLAQFGIPNVLADPVMELHGPTGFTTIINDNWRDDPTQEALIIASGIPPTNDFEAAIDAILPLGAYTAVVRGNNETSGAGLIEVYDLGQAVDSKLANISTRAFVSTGDDIVIAGFILGNHSGDNRVIVRGIGPSLSQLLGAELANPTLELRNGDGVLFAYNDDWQDDPAQAAQIIAAGLAPSEPAEAGIAATLSPGLYTALLAGLNNSTGVGLVEVYNLGAP